ncbi:MAG: hypothetical protein EU532_11305 [Promethearchaeota archaeon]|nr:MAG: hypothetical protein EU532_11305 [Candidatus Lokiarchaeota archaeon]
MEGNNEENKNKISVGLIISKDDFKKNPIFPDEVLEEISDQSYYLLIFISREDVIKISCFPTDTNNIKKVLIHLTEFSPELVKGISSVLKELDLSKHILHTTGLCYEMDNCFYETYLVGDNLQTNNVSIQSIKDKFLSLAKVINVIIENIPVFNK